MLIFRLPFITLQVMVALLAAGSAECQTFEGVPGCRTTRLELVFLVDGSSRVSYSSFNIVKQWILNVTLNFDISPSTTRVAVVQFSSYPQTEFGLNTYSDIKGVLRGIRSINYMSGSTQIGLALRHNIESVFSEARPEAAKVVILLSDGPSHDEVYDAASALRASGIATFAIGVGSQHFSAMIRELQEITSGPPEYNDNVFLVNNFASLHKIEEQVINAVCGQTIQECPTATQDLTFIIDGSSTIGYSDFMKVKEWMKKIINAFDIGPDYTRVAVVQYSSDVKEVFNFRDLLSKQEVIDAIDHMEYMTGDTHTGEALMHMLNTIYTERNGDRPNVPDLAIVMTDGKSQESDLVIAASKAVHEAGITVYAVGVGKYSIDEVRVIASNPDKNYVIEALNFDIVDLKRVGLVKSICTDLEKTCPTANADLVFLIDGSTSIGSRNFKHIKQWMKNIVDAFHTVAYFIRASFVHPFVPAAQLLLCEADEQNISAANWAEHKWKTEWRLNTTRLRSFILDGSYDDDEPTSNIIGPFYTRVAVVQFTDIPYLEFGLTEYETTQTTLQAIQSIRFRRGSTNIGKAVEFTLNRVFSEQVANVPKILIALTDEESQDDIANAVNSRRKNGMRSIVFGISNSQPGQLHAITSETRNVFRAIGFDKIRKMQSKLISFICKEVEPECYRQEIDMHFLVDSSSSISSTNYKKVKTWIKNIVRSFDVGEYTTRVALTQFAATPKPEFNFDQYSTKREIEYVIDGLELMGGPTMTATALEFIISSGFSLETRERSTSPKVLIVISDGRSGDDFEDVATRLHESGIYVFCVGAGNTRKSAMEMIGSQPLVAHVQEASNFDVINKFRRDIVGEICRETKPECPETEMDLIFLMDGSDSIGTSNFEITKEWIISFVEEFEIGEYNTRVGVVHYSSSARSEIDMGDFSNQEDLTNAIIQIEFQGGAANIGLALKFIRSVVFSQEYGARRGVPKVLIILTDGAATQEQVSRATRDLRRDGVEIYAIGVGKANITELNSVMLEPPTANVYHVRNYNAIQSIKSGLIRRVCMKVTPDCGKTATDLMFLVDGSTSVGKKDWMTVKAFMQNITEKFTITRNYVRVGVIQYSTYPQVSIAMENYRNKSDLQNALSKMNWQTGDTYTARALRYVLRSYQSVPPREIVEENKLLIVITDGQAQDNLEIIPAVTKLHDAGWRVFAIGIDEASLSELNVLASNPDYDHVFYADNFLSTRKFQGRLARLICDDSRYGSQPSTKPLFNLQHTSPFPRKHTPNQVNDQQRPQQYRNRKTGQTRADSLRNDIALNQNILVQATTSSLLQSPNTSIAAESAALGNRNTSECPVLWRSGHKVEGINFLEELGIRQGPKKLFKARRGSISTTQAYRIKQGKIPVTPLRSLFTTSQLPSSFTLIAVFKMHGQAIKDSWTLMSVVASTGSTMFGVSLNGKDRTLHITRSSRPILSFVETATLEGPLVASLFNHDYHKLEVIVHPESVTVLIDCQQVPKQLKFESPILNNLQTMASFVISQRKATVVDIQDLSLICGKPRTEQCCEIPGKKCVPLASISTECGCLPSMKQAEVREAEMDEVRQLATLIATQIVEEKIQALLVHLNLNP